MILRQFQVTIHEGKEAEFDRIFRDEILPMVKSHDGLESGLLRENLGMTIQAYFA
jgi:hypothetical protein